MDDTGSKRVAFMLRQLGLLPDPNARRWTGNGAFPFPRREQQVPPSEPNIVRWAREQREQEALRTRFRSAFPRSARAPRPEPTALTEIPRALSKPMRDFLTGQDPTTDWSKVRLKLGGTRPGSYASTDGNTASFSEPFPENLRDFFHEMGHIPDWQDGTLTTPKYIAQAILSAGRYATRAPATYGMHARRLLPNEPSNAIWEDITYERAAAERAKRWNQAWKARKRPPPK